MNQIELLRQQIVKAESIRAESQENLLKNPESYSARLLLMSIENHLADLYKQVDDLKNSK